MPSNNGTHPEDRRTSTPTPEEADLLTEAESLRTQLQEALARGSRLIAALRHERRRHKAVEAAVASLKRLQHLER